ncbi:hypothetical protein M9H77_34568 [Catharanthus roseus]|uniref:Uncharacterized protein n=1 Tax=Catharanthus roseus TaxID=4058 RepID=A0ACB9ZNE8_CATRO|nr:hypothetical protein M9H77_34568 [Catharanthus roseus]
MVCGSKKKSAHLEMSTTASASIPLGTSASPTTTSTLPATLTPFPQFSYSSPMPISTPSSSTVETSSRPAPSSSTRPPVPSIQGVVDSRTLILPTDENFNKQTICAKLITEIIKEHFVEAHASFRKILDRIKNMWHIEFGKRYQ